MTADAVQARRTMLSRPWVRFAIRAAFVLLAMWVLHLAQDRYLAFWQDYADTFRFDWWSWLAAIGIAASAGLLFGLAVFFPFSRVRYLWSRLLLAVIPLVLLAPFWLVWGYLLPRHHGVGRWLVTTQGWFGDRGTQFALAVLVGVAIASGLQAVID